MKKILCILIALSILFSTCFAVTNNDSIDTATNILIKMKIIIGDENGKINTENSLTRAEFATIIVRLLSIETNKITTKKIDFKDVPSSFWGYNNIYNCVNNGYLVGDGDGFFRPNDAIKYEEVLTIMLRILNKANDLTNWPDDYINKANDLKINENVIAEKNEKISRGNSFIIIYNCLTTSLI